MSEQQTLATYLIALALLQKNQRTHVNYEIKAVIEKLQTELNLTN